MTETHETLTMGLTGGTLVAATLRFR